MNRDKAKLKISTYIYLLVTFGILMLAFLLFMEVDTIMAVYSSRSDDLETERSKIVYREQYDEVTNDSSIYNGDYSTDHRNTAVIGDTDLDMTQLAAAQLTHIRESFYNADSLNLISDERIENTDVFIVTEVISSSDIEKLGELSKTGKTVLFLNSIDSSNLYSDTVQEVLGVKSYLGVGDFTGYRIAIDLGFDSMQQQVETEFQAAEVTLQSGAKKYAYALADTVAEGEIPVVDPNIKNEELPPLMWRYINDGSRIYVCNSDLFDSSLAYNVVTTLYSELQETYIYPIVNAYMFMISGMPYTSNFESDILTSLYNRDALNMQNSVFFPQFTSSVERYQLEITWYSPEYDEVMSTSDKNIKYYLEDMQVNESELAKLVDDRMISDTTLLNYAIDWNSDFTFVNKEEDAINLPKILTHEEFEENEITSNSIIKSLGFMSVYVNIDDYLADADYSKSWVDFCLNYESILGYHNKKFVWLDKVTAEEAAKRVTSYLTMEPEFIYEEDGIRINIDKFIDKAYFVVQCDEDFTEESMESLTPIGNNMYLLRVYQDTIKLYYEE